MNRIILNLECFEIMGANALKLWANSFLVILLFCLFFPFFTVLPIQAETQIIRVGIDRNAPPIEFEENGEARGFNIDLMKLIAQKNSWQLQFIFMDWSNVLDSVKDGSLDVMFAIQTTERERIYDFSRSFLNITWMIYVQKDVIGISSVNDLKGRTVAVVNGFAEHNYLKENASDIIIIPVDSTETGLELLERGDVFAFFGQHHMVQYSNQIHNYRNIKSIGTPLNYISMGIAVNQGNDDLLLKIDVSLNELFESGDYKTLYNRWYGESLSEQSLNNKLLQYFIYGAIGLVGIIFLLTIWSNSLKNVVRRQMKELEASQVFYRKLIDLSPIPAAIATTSGEIEYMNPKLIQTIGYTQKELPNTKNWFEKLYPDPTYRQYVINEWSSATQNFPKDQDRVWVFNVHTKSGRDLQIEFRLVMIDEKRAYVLMNDITDRQIKEEEMRRSVKLDSLSVLAGGIAHDFNNILMTLLASVNLLQIEENLKPDVKDLVNSMEKAIIRAKSITNQLLTFSKGGTPIKKVQSIIPILQDVVNLALRGRNCVAEIEIEPEIPYVNIDEGQISQVFHNLILNAVQAMPNGGIIKISVRLAMVDEIKRANLIQTDYIIIKFHDNGTGIPPDSFGKIFTPYFTTKPKGSGLGLATSYSIIRNHHGTITFTSELNHGTTFSVFLPKSSLIPNEKSISEPPITKFHGRILILDDDRNINNLLTMMLIKLGFTVSSVTDGLDVIRLFIQAKAENNPFDLIIMDLTIPGGIGGKDALQELRKTCPDVKAIVSSGYSNDPILANYLEYGFIGAIQKPYTFNDLTEILKKIFSPNEKN